MKNNWLNNIFLNLYASFFYFYIIYFKLIKINSDFLTFSTRTKTSIFLITIICFIIFFITKTNKKIFLISIKNKILQKIHNFLVFIGTIFTSLLLIFLFIYNISYNLIG